MSVKGRPFHRRWLTAAGLSDPNWYGISPLKRLMTRLHYRQAVMAGARHRVCTARTQRFLCTVHAHPTIARVLRAWLELLGQNQLVVAGVA